MTTGYGDSEWFEDIKIQLNYLPKDVGFEDIWEEKMNEDGCANP